VLAYLCLALGTKLAHRFLFWGCLGSVVGSLLGAMLVLPVLFVVTGVERSVGIDDVASTIMLIALLVYCLATAVVYAYLAVLVHRGMKRLYGRK